MKKMMRYSRDKNSELQQRCLEYKRTQAKNNPIEKNNFTTIEETPSIDFSLSFLNGYSKEKSNGKVYDTSISDMFLDKFGSNEVQINFRPYAQNTNITSMPSLGANINSLYEAGDDNNLSLNMKSELNVKAEQKWSVQGYKEEKKNYEKPGYLSIEGISNKTILESNKISTSSNTYKTSKTKKKEDLIPENQEKKKLIKDLFDGMGGEEKKSTKK